MKPTIGKIKAYRDGCVHFCTMYVDYLKNVENPDRKCPKVLHPYEGMETHEGAGKESYCNNLVECALCFDRHYEKMKDKLLAPYGVRRTYRDK